MTVQGVHDFPAPKLLCRRLRHREGHGRIDGPRRRSRGQRGHGELFSLLQKNVLDRRSWATREDLRIAIVTWIERTYHRRRRQSALGRLTPIGFDTIMTLPAAQAA